MVYYTVNNYLVGGLEHFLFSPIVGMVIQSDFHIFQGVGQPPTSYNSSIFPAKTGQNGPRSYVFLGTSVEAPCPPMVRRRMRILRVAWRMCFLGDVNRSWLGQQLELIIHLYTHIYIYIYIYIWW